MEETNTQQVNKTDRFWGRVSIPKGFPEITCGSTLVEKHTSYDSPTVGVIIILLLKNTLLNYEIQLLKPGFILGQSIPRSFLWRGKSIEEREWMRQDFRQEVGITLKGG